MSDCDDRIVVYGAAASGGHTWTARERDAVQTIARAIVFTTIDLIRDTGWETEFETASITEHDWKAIDEECDRILREHKPIPAPDIETALAVLARRAPEGA